MIPKNNSTENLARPANLNGLPLLISRRDIDALARPCLTDDHEAEKFIREAELIDLVPQIGAKTYEIIKSAPRDNEDVLSGGVWRGENGRSYHFAGLRTALAYYAYARIIKNGGHVAARFGYTEKRDEYSSHVELKQRTAEANDAYAVAVEHMKGVIAYIKANVSRFGACGCDNSPSLRNTGTPRYIVIKS